jgi:prepilin-type processing-associated H-X9-DG protein
MRIHTSEEKSHRVPSPVPPAISYHEAPHTVRPMGPREHYYMHAGNATPDRLLPRVRLNTIENPAQAYLAADSNLRSFAHYDQAKYLSETDGFEQTVTDRHSGRVNVLFVDGSIQSVTPEMLDWSPTSAGVSERSPWGTH